MTVRKYLEENGWDMKVHPHHHYMSVRIQFINDDGKDDETEFDIFAYSVDELEELYETFCRENGFATDTVTDIYIFKSARTMEKLQEE